MLAFSIDYYGMIFRATQSVELFCAYITKTQTAIVARNCRLQEWAQMIQDCQNRPIGVTVSEWCQEHSITTSNYYYRMAQVRKACLDSLSNEVVEQAIVPIPMNVISSSHSS